MEIWISIEAQTLQEFQDRVLVCLPFLHKLGGEATILTVVIGVTHLHHALTEIEADLPLTWAVLCLADGMGGMESGEVASQTAVGSLLRLAAANVHVVRDSEQRYSELKRWISVANEEVCSALDRRHARGGTTIVCGFLWEGELISAHVGDSRLYLVRGGKAETLTRDHSLAMGLVVQGEISLDEIRHHPDRNRVTRSLGERIPLPEYYADTLQVCSHSRAGVAPGAVAQSRGDGVGSGSNRHKALPQRLKSGWSQPVAEEGLSFGMTYCYR